MARLEIKWGQKAADTATEKDTAKQGEKKVKLLPKPILVYLTTADQKTKTLTNRIERTVFKAEKVGLACHFFECHKVNGDFIRPDFPYAALVKGKALPRVVLIPRDQDPKKVKRLEGKKVSGTKLFSAMTKVSDAHCPVKLAKYVGGMLKVLGDLDKLDQMTKKNAADKKRGRAKKGEDQRIQKFADQIKAAEAKLTKKKFKVDPKKAKSGDG